MKHMMDRWFGAASAMGVVVKREHLHSNPHQMTLPRRVAGLCLRDRDIRGELGVRPLLLCIKRSQQRWFNPVEGVLACSTGRRPYSRLSIALRD